MMHGHTNINLMYVLKLQTPECWVFEMKIRPMIDYDSDHIKQFNNWPFTVFCILLFFVLSEPVLNDVSTW